MRVIDLPIPVRSNQIFELGLPKGAVVLSAAPQLGVQVRAIEVPNAPAPLVLVLSVLIEDGSPELETRRFALVESGQVFKWALGTRYVGTTFAPGASKGQPSIGLHLFELPSSTPLSNGGSCVGAAN